MSLKIIDATTNSNAVLPAAGYVGYTWDISSDALRWIGSISATLQLSDTDAISSGRRFVGRINPEDLTQRQHCLNRHLVAGEEFDCEYRVRNETGNFIWVHDRGRVERNDAGLPTRMMGVIRPLGLRGVHHARLQLLADYDDLTGHFNLLRLKMAVREAVDASRISGDSGAYLAVGIDNMMTINDAVGIDAADNVIVEIGRRLDICLGVKDAIGRIAGDRFGILLPDCLPENVGAIAEQMLSSVNETPIDTGVGPVFATVSIGSVTVPAQAERAEDVMTRAEAALGAAKRSGRDCFAPYRLSEASRRAQRDGIAMGERVQRALKEERLVFAYQPVVSSETGAVDYYECLLRMIDEGGKIIAAGAFVPLVEELGFIRAIDRYVLERAAAELAAHPDVTLGFNISGLTAANRPWLRSIIAILKNNPSIASRMVVEITETAALADLDESAKFVTSLRDLGCRVALDDFGAGFTSLRHLQKLPVDTVKIDGSFVRDLAHNRENQVFLRHLIGLARGFGLTTIAECVETAEEAAILRREEVGFLQGYFFGRPTIEHPWAAGRSAASEQRSTGS